MAIRHVIESDISGKPDAATVTFGFAGTWYEIDLTAEEQDDLQLALKTYLQAGREARKKESKPKMVPDTSYDERMEIRAWAKEQGLELADRGRVPKHILKAYDEAHGITRTM